METLRRLKLVVACLLAAVLLGGSVLPPPAAVWQCRHAVRIVDAAWTMTRSAMPCGTGAMPMPHMACCPLDPAISSASAAASASALLRTSCNPTLTCSAALPLASVPDARAHLRRSLAVLLASLPLPPALVPPVPALLSLRQRPPPTFGFPQSACERSPGLRAPPAA